MQRLNIVLEIKIMILFLATIWMNFSSWLSYVEELSQTRGLDIHDVREALILCGKPSRPALPFDKSALTNRLTDPSRC